MRHAQPAPFRATNVQVVRAEAAAESGAGRGNAPAHSLFDFVVDDVRAGTVRAYTGLDIVLTGLVHPESPKLIKMKLEQLDLDGILDKSTAGVDVPLYLNLTRTQFEDVLYQLGLPERENDVALVRMNVQGVAGYRLDPTEQFINQFIGRMGRHKTNTQSTWDNQENFFQSINFKIRIGPQKKEMIGSTRKLARGQKGKICTDKNGCLTEKACPDDMLCDQGDQFTPFGKLPKKDNFYQQVDDDRIDELKQGYHDKLVSEGKVTASDADYLKKRKRDQEQQDEDYDEFLDKEPKEDGTSHAAVMEHVMRLTTHRVGLTSPDVCFMSSFNLPSFILRKVMSPRLRAALESVSALIGYRIDKKDDLEHVMDCEKKNGRSYLMTLMEAEFQEGESMLRSYRDPRAEEALTNARVYAAGRLRKALRV